MHRLTIALPLVLCLGTEALGQEPPKTDEATPTQPANTELARRHYELGEQLYKTSSYPEALVEFQKAYKLAPRTELLFNIARCHEVMAQLKQAIDAYERYLEEKPGADNADLVRSRVANLRRQLEAQPSKQPQKSKAKGKAPPPPPPPKPAEKPSRWKRTAGWITLGVSVAALATGIAFGAMAAKKADEYTPATKLYNELQEIDRQGKRYNKVAIATLVVGGVAAAAGAGLVVWDLTGQRKANEERPAAVVVPFADDRGAGLAGLFEF